MNVLFVCTGNTCRSPMAAALLRHWAEQHGRTDLHVESAGLCAAGEPASPLAVDVLAAWHIDLSAHRSRSVNSVLLNEADVIAVMSPSHAAALLAAGADMRKMIVLAQEKGGIPDPYGGDRACYLATRDALQQAVEQLALTRLSPSASAPAHAQKPPPVPPSAPTSHQGG